MARGRVCNPSPDTFTTAVRPAPRHQLRRRWIAVVMKLSSAPPPITRNSTYDERAIALARRLGIDIPSPPLTGAQWQALWAGIGKVLLRIEPPEPLTLQALWADVGMHLAERSEPEFQWGAGRRLGSKNKQVAPVVTKEAQRKRRQRQQAERGKKY